MRVPPSKRIIIVEGDEATRLELRNCLADLGYDVFESDSCEAAVSTALTDIPVVIFLDLNLCEAEGIDAIMEIRKYELLTQIPILASSSDGKRGIELFTNMDKLGTGKIEYIPKPINLSHIEFYLEEILPKLTAAA